MESIVKQIKKPLYDLVFDLTKSGKLEYVSFSLISKGLDVFINGAIPKTSEDIALAEEMERWLYEIELLYVSRFIPFIQNDKLFILAESICDEHQFGEPREVIDLERIQTKALPLISKHVKGPLSPDSVNIFLALTNQEKIMIERYAVSYSAEEEIDLSDDQEIQDLIIHECLTMATPLQNNFPNSHIYMAIEDNYVSALQIQWSDTISLEIID